MNPNQFWDKRYNQEDYVYGTLPNAFFAEQLANLSPGRLLLPAEGEGRNAVYAASLGWEVSAFDLSAIGRTKALALAKAKEVSIDYQLGTIEDVSFAENSFDVVASIYAHFKPLYESPITAYLKPGGYLILEGFAKEQIEYQKIHQSGGPKHPDMLYSVEQIQQDFQSLTIHYLEEVEVELREGAYHEGLAKVVRLFAQRKL